MFDLSFYLPTAGLLPLAEYIHDPDNALFDLGTMLSANLFLTSLRALCVRRRRPEPSDSSVS